MFAQAMRSTMTMVPIRTQRTLPTSPTRSCLKGRRRGPIRASSNIFLLKPGGAGKRSNERGNRRATSASACVMVTPGLSRATD